MYKILSSLFVVSLTLVAQERSMFGAGDLNSPNPYGLTPTEKVVAKNKQTLTQAQKRIKKVDTLIKELSERIEGLESLFEGDGQKLHGVYQNLNKHLKEFESYKAQTENFKAQVRQDIQSNSELLNKNSDLILVNQKNIKLLEDSFEKIVTKVNDIDKNYVSTEEFNKLLKMLDKKESKKVKSTKNTKAKTKSQVPDMPNNKLMAEARRLFKIDYFTNAIPILKHLIEENYRPAECNFLMGEIKYYRKKYDEALHYFKTSMMLYDKASYLPKLLLHSAISFEKTGDKDNAKNFYGTLIDIYPDTNEAKEASKKITKL